MGLRLAEGIDLGKLSARFGYSNETLIDHRNLARYCDLGLIWTEGQRIGVTAKGFPLLDGLLAEIVSEELVSA